MKAEVFNIQKFSLQDGPGIRTSVFFSRCNLNCAWCANPECHQQAGNLVETSEYELQELLQEVQKDKAFYDRSGGGVTLTGGEIFMQEEFVGDFCLLLKETGIHVVLETAGAVENERFARLAGLADFVYIDCKHYEDEKHRKGTGVSNREILDNIAWLVQSSIPYCVRIPIIPGYNDSAQDAENFGKLLCRLGAEQVELLPFHQFGEGKYQKYGMSYAFAGVKPLHREELQAYAQQLKSDGIHVLLK